MAERRRFLAGGLPALSLPPLSPAYEPHRKRDADEARTGLGGAFWFRCQRLARGERGGPPASRMLSGDHALPRLTPGRSCAGGNRRPQFATIDLMPATFPGSLGISPIFSTCPRLISAPGHVVGTFRPSGSPRRARCVRRANTDLFDDEAAGWQRQAAPFEQGQSRRPSGRLDLKQNQRSELVDGRWVNDGDPTVGRRDDGPGFRPLRPGSIRRASAARRGNTDEKHAGMVSPQPRAPTRAGTRGDGRRCAEGRGSCASTRKDQDFAPLGSSSTGKQHRGALGPALRQDFPHRVSSGRTAPRHRPETASPPRSTMEGPVGRILGLFHRVQQRARGDCTQNGPSCAGW